MSFAFCVDLLEVKGALATTDAEQQLPERPGKGTTTYLRPSVPSHHVKRLLAKKHDAGYGEPSVWFLVPSVSRRELPCTAVAFRPVGVMQVRQRSVNAIRRMAVPQAGAPAAQSQSRASL
jgi:hypothetical protein